MKKSEKNLLTSNAKFDDVIKDMNALDLHYQRYQNGNKDALAVNCFRYVEHNASLSAPWALRIQAGVHTINVRE